MEALAAPGRESTPVEVEDETAGAAGIAAGGGKAALHRVRGPSQGLALPEQSHGKDSAEKSRTAKSQQAWV